MSQDKHFIDRKGEYVDALGRPLSVGDVIMYPTARSNSVFNNYAQIVKIKPTDQPTQVGIVDGVSIFAWGHSFELKVEYLQWSRMERRFIPPTIWDRNAPGGWRERRPDEKRKVNTIKRVDRVLRLDLDDE